VVVVGAVCDFTVAADFFAAELALDAEPELADVLDALVVVALDPPFEAVVDLDALVEAALVLVVLVEAA
jgi:hypothetical protein